MNNIEYKSVALEVSELNIERRTAVIAHAVYDNIDRYGDISRKGMFNKSWRETKASDIRFDIDHDRKQQPGVTTSVFEDEKKAYTKVRFGSHTLGTDTMLMMDEGIIRGASFEFITEKKADVSVKGRKIRELKEVRHIATTVALGLDPVNPLAGVVSVTKAGTDALRQFKAHIDKMESFCRNTTASDDCIKALLQEIEEIKGMMSTNDTVDTLLITEPAASVKEFSNALHLLKLKI
jgi:phage head maturation protease